MQKPTSRIAGAFAGVIALILVAGAAAQQRNPERLLVPPVPVEQLTPETMHDLGRCLVAESDFGRLTEYSAIAHVLARRWASAASRDPSKTFDGMIRRYCAVLRTSSPSPRQEWVLALPDGQMTSDPGFPSTVDWRNYAPKWDVTRQFVRNWAAGQMRNPLPLAEHFGGGMDHPPLGAVMLPRRVRSIITGKLVLLGNTFYRIDQALRRLGQRAPMEVVHVPGATLPAALAAGGHRR